MSATILSLKDNSYTQGSGALAIDTAALIDGSGLYRGGHLSFAVSGGNAGTESLALSTVTTADTTTGAISIVGNDVFRGTGSGTEIIGAVDSTLNGQAGSALRINFLSAGFPNGDFNIGQNGDVNITGWTSALDRIRLDGVALLAGWATPIDTTYPGQNTTTDNSTQIFLNTPAAAAISNLFAAGPADLSVKLDTDALSINEAFGIIRGPSVFSNDAIALTAGDTVSFAWKALGTGDAYDAYGYLLNVDTGATINLLDQTGSSAGESTEWATVSRTLVGGEAGNYRFVFVAGSFDASGGQFLGGSLMIDDVAVTLVTPATPITADDLEAVARLVSYANASSGTGSNLATLTTTAVDDASVSASTTSKIWLSSTYTGPVASVQYQWSGTPNNDVNPGTSGNDFIALGAGDDAAFGGDGNDIIDGGTGSNFLSGGSGIDRFFLDARGTGSSWSTITDFTAGEEVALWGWQAGVSNFVWVENDGATAYRGVTFHADVDGNGLIDTSITWVGLTQADLPVPTQTSVDGTGLLWFV